MTQVQIYDCSSAKRSHLEERHPPIYMCAHIRLSLLKRPRVVHSFAYFEIISLTHYIQLSTCQLKFNNLQVVLPPLNTLFFVLLVWVLTIMLAKSYSHT